MKPIQLFLVLFLFTCISVSAQTKVEIKETVANPNPLTWDVALMPGIVVKRGYTSDFILGAETRIGKKFNANVGWLASAGYTHFTSDENGFIHAKGGLKIFFTPAFYLAGEIGFGEYTQGGEAFIYAPSLGITTGKWDLGIKYESFESTTNYPAQAALRIGYRLSK